jgi:hypothetical protein
MGMSQLEAMLLQARLEAKGIRQQRSPPESDHAHRERNLHDGILAACRLRNWLVFHGSMAHRTYRTPGEPDFVILAHGGKTFLVEAKTRQGKLTMEQRGMQLWAEKLGHKVAVVRSMKEFYQLIG